MIAQVVLFGSLIGVGGMALAIDTGQMFSARAEMQRLTDCAALAGASGLIDGTEVVGNRVNALAVANAMVATPDDDDYDAYDSSGETTEFTIGYWKGNERAFYPVVGSPLVTPNAVQVKSGRANVSLFFARFLGMDDFDVARSSVAVISSGQCVGIWGLEGISGTGDLYSNSYDSQVGGYGPGNINANGDLCSCQDIDVAGDVAIYGDAMYGDGYAFTGHGGSYEVFGIIDDHPCDVVAPTFDMADGLASNDNGLIGLTDDGRNPFRGATMDLMLAGTDNLTLAPGTYYFSDVQMTGSATLTVTGPTIIYVAGSPSFAGGGVTNVTQDPNNLIIYSDASSMDLRGAAGFYGAVIAPDSDVRLVGTTNFLERC